MNKRVADIIMDTLADNGVTDAFCVTGGGAMYLNNAMAVSNRIKTYFNHHEQACAMAAEGYARYSGKIALCCVTSGPGGTNALTGVMGAYQDSLPIIILSGQVRYNTTVEESGLPLRRRGEQEFAITNSLQNMVKYAKMVIDPLSIKQEIQKALNIAYEGRRGPVWLDIPLNVQSAVVNEDDLLPILPRPEIFKCADSKLDSIYNLLNGAKRPCILAGTGIRSSNLWNQFVEFIDSCRIPVVGASCLADALYSEHPLYFGETGVIGCRCGNLVLQNSDVLLVLGSSLGFKQTGFTQDSFAPNAKIIMVDVDSNEAKKPGLRIDNFIQCDLSYFFAHAQAWHITPAHDWLQYCNMLKLKFPFLEPTSTPDVNQRIDSATFWSKFSVAEPQDSIVVLGNSTPIQAKIQASVKTKMQRVLVNINCGAMGCDIAPAIGASIAAKRPVYCIAGDGSFMMNMQELSTIKYNDLPVKIILFSNGGYAAVRNTCKNYFNSRNFGCTTESGLFFPDFNLIAQAFGFPYRKCMNVGELTESIHWINDQKSFAILEVWQKYDDPTQPRLVSRLNADGTFEKAKLEDMYPFLDRTELNNLMIK